MIFLVLSGKMIFLFPENMILHIGRKIKDDLSEKIHGNMIFSLNLLKIWSFQRCCAGTWSFLYYLERWYFSPENMTFLPWAESERRPFPGNTWKHDASPSEKKKQETWYLGSKFDLFLNLSGWRYSTMNNLQYIRYLRLIGTWKFY